MTPEPHNESATPQVAPGDTPGRLKPLYWLTVTTVMLFARLWLRIEVRHKERVPARGPFMIVPTHTSFLDPPIAGSALGYECHFLSRDGILKVPLLGWLCRKLNAHPIRRGAGDREALRICRNVLREGHPLVFFPEGTRSSDGRLGPIQKGWIMILDNVPGVPYVPVVMQDTYKVLPRGSVFPRPRKLRMTVGEPTLLPARRDGEPTREYYDRCAADLERRYRELGAL